MSQDLDRLAGEWVASEVSARVKAALNARGLTQAAVASALGVGLKEANRKLNGHSAYDLSDLVALSLRFGPEVFPSFTGRDELFPPEVRSRVRWVEGSDGSHPVVDTIQPSGVDFSRLADDVGLLQSQDTGWPRRLTTSYDIRRSIVLALILQGVLAARIFSFGRRTDWLVITPGRSLVVAPFVSAGSSDAEVIARDRDDLLASLRALSYAEAVTNLLVALMPEELLVAVADTLEFGVAPESPFRLLDRTTALDGTVRAVGAAGPESVVIFEIASDANQSAIDDVDRARVDEPH